MSKTTTPLAPKQEVDAALEDVFSAMEKAISKVREENRRDLTEERVDTTISALFDAVNQAQALGRKAAVPNFEKLLTTSEK